MICWVCQREMLALGPEALSKAEREACDGCRPSFTKTRETLESAILELREPPTPSVH